MKASLTELHRKTAGVMAPVLSGLGSVTITDFGQDRAQISPVLPSVDVPPEELRGHLTPEAILEALGGSRS